MRLNALHPSSCRAVCPRAAVRAWAVAALVFAPAALLPSVAVAQPVLAPSAQERARAELLFREARDLMTVEKFAEACPKFAESYQLDPAGGTLLNLAVCHEKEGKLASAWSEFLDTESLAKKEGQADREAYAHKKAEALLPQLSYLRVVVPPAAQVPAGLELRLDGSPIRKSSWGSKLPVDPGEHLVEATAPQHKSVAAKIVAEKGPAEQTFELSPLEPLVANASTPAVAPGPMVLAPLPPAAEYIPGQNQRLGGYITGGAGIVALGLGTIFGVRTLSLKSDRSAECDASGCSVAGVQADRDARSAATLSTVSFVAGGVLLAGGAALVLTAPSGTSRARVGISPLAGGGFTRAEVSF